MASAFTLIEDTVLSGAAASITFNTGLTDYTKFRLTVYTIKSTTANAVIFRLNGDSGSNYVRQRITADSSTVSPARWTSQTYLMFTPYTSLPINGTGLFVVSISKPLTTTPARAEISSSYFGDLATDAVLLNTITGEWNNTADLISSIAIIAGSGDFATGTRAVLEGAA
jgi:hypothetical protein